jgi:alpha-N-acetylglucosamine transferase
MSLLLYHTVLILIKYYFNIITLLLKFHTVFFGLAVLLKVTYPREMKIYRQEGLSTNIHSIIYNSQNCKNNCQPADKEVNKCGTSTQQNSTWQLKGMKY